MNTSAEKHLAKAEGYLAKGEEFYRKAAAEIDAAREADPTLTHKQIGERVGQSESWVQHLVAWRKKGHHDVPWSSSDAKNVKYGAKKLLRDAPLEQVERVIAELPPERQQDIAAAAGHAYSKARQDYRETERNLTPAQRKEREAAGEAMTRPVVSTVASFTIVGRLETALEELRELNAGGAVPAGMIDPLGQVLKALNDEYRVIRAMAGLDIDLDQVTT